MEGARPVRAPRGSTLTARSWQTEAPLRMLMNNLDPEVAERPDDLDDALARVLAARTERRARSVGLVGNCATVLPELLRRGVAVDVVTDQTSAHDPLSYLPEGIALESWHAYADAEPEEFTERARASMAKHVAAMVGFLDAGAEVFDYGNSIREEARLGGFERAFAFNEMVASGELSAPVVIGRDHLDCGSVASPYRETEAMLDSSDAIADWPLLNALVNTASGATWVSIHHGGGVGMGRSIHAGQVTVADGTALAGQKIERVLTNDPAMGVVRHVDAGYERAGQVAAAHAVRVPMGDS